MPNAQYYINLTREVYGYGTADPPEELVAAYTKWKKAHSMGGVKIKSVKNDLGAFTRTSDKDIKRIDKENSSIRAKKWLLTQNLECFKLRGKGEESLKRSLIVRELRENFGLEYVWMARLLTELIGRPVRKAGLLYIYNH